MLRGGMLPLKVNKRDLISFLGLAYCGATCHLFASPFLALSIGSGVMS
jgi:hypothetical protein